MSELKKTITVVDRTAKNLGTVATSLQKTFQEANGVVATLIATVENQLFEIEAKESQLTSLAQEYTDKERIAKAELQIRLAENEEKVVTEILASRKRTSIPVACLDALNEEVEALKTAIDVEVKQAVGKATAIADSARKVEIEKLNLEHAAKTAEVTAELRYAKEQLTAKDTLIKELQSQIAADREARIEIAKAEANKQAQTINVSK